MFVIKKLKKKLIEENCGEACWGKKIVRNSGGA